MSEVKKAEKTEKAAKKAGEGKLSKIIKWIKALPGRIATPFRNMVHELKRVTWPSKKKTITYSIIVLVFIVFMMVIIGLFDLGSTAVINIKKSDLGGETAIPATISDLVGTEEATPGDLTGSEEAAPEITDEAPEAAQTTEEAAE